MARKEQEGNEKTVGCLVLKLYSFELRTSVPISGGDNLLSYLFNVNVFSVS